MMGMGNEYETCRALDLFPPRHGSFAVATLESTPLDRVDDRVDFPQSSRNGRRCASDRRSRAHEPPGNSDELRCVMPTPSLACHQIVTRANQADLTTRAD